MIFKTPFRYLRYGIYDTFDFVNQFCYKVEPLTCLIPFSYVIWSLQDIRYLYLSIEFEIPCTSLAHYHALYTSKYHYWARTLLYKCEAQKSKHFHELEFYSCTRKHEKSRCSRTKTPPPPSNPETLLCFLSPRTLAQNSKSKQLEAPPAPGVNLSSMEAGRSLYSQYIQIPCLYFDNPVLRRSNIRRLKGIWRAQTTSAPNIVAKINPWENLFPASVSCRQFPWNITGLK